MYKHICPFLSNPGDQMTTYLSWQPFLGHFWESKISKQSPTLQQIIVDFFSSLKSSLSRFLEWSLIIFITWNIQTIDLIFILILKNLDWTTENNSQKPTTVCLLYLKGLPEKIQMICSDIQDQKVQSGNYCYSSLRVDFIDEVKILPSKMTLTETFCPNRIALYVLCFDLLTRPKMPFKVMHRKEVTHSNGSYERKSRGRKLTDEMGRARKIPMVHYRVMHWKRVTSELHDSYFRLMTIKHSISKIE